MAVIDEIQLLRDPGRGWAWTRAFLGIIAEEVHVCGEFGAAELLKRLCETTGETVEVINSTRITVWALVFFFKSKLFRIADSRVQKTYKFNG